MVSPKILTTVVLLAVVFQAKADHVTDPTFQQTVQALATSAQAVSEEAVFDAKENVAALTGALSADQIVQLGAISKSQGEIWGDTILEGDYEADGKTQVDHVDALKVDGQLVAYRVRYSERAWDTSECTFPANFTKEALSQCQEGRIEEASLVSPDFTSWIRDPKMFASFAQK